MNYIKTPEGLRLAAEVQEPVELVGDLHAMKYLDLDKEGLGEYRDYLIEKGVIENKTSTLNTV